MGFIPANNSKIKTEKQESLFRQTYDKAPTPKGVFILKLAVFPDDWGGSFKENLRVNDQGYVASLLEQGINFKIMQSNTSVFTPGCHRFWHVHPEQNELLVTSRLMIVGLIDRRSDSPTYNVKSKIVLSADKALYVPAGVTHGFLNPDTKNDSVLIYFTDKYFVPGDDTQEYRIDPKNLPFDFVKPEIM